MAQDHSYHHLSSYKKRKEKKKKEKRKKEILNTHPKQRIYNEN
jgi:hypothetical protein